MGQTIENQLRVGSRVIAEADNGPVRAGERGVVYDVRVSGETARFGILFEKGVYREYSEEQLTGWLSFKPGDIVQELAGYRFINAGTLLADLQRGRFRAAFPPQSTIRA